MKPNEDGCDVKYILNWKVIECLTPEDPCADAELISWKDVVNIPATSGKWYKIDVRTAVESGKDIKFTVINGDEPNKVNVKFNTECFIVPDEPVDEPTDEPVEPTNTITVRAKVPDYWTDQIYVWVWPDDGNGVEYVAEKDGDWWSYTHEGEYVNIIFKNGIGWNGPDYQTIDMRFTSDVCLQLGGYAWDDQFGGQNKISYVEVPCDSRVKIAPYEIADEYNEFNSVFAANETKSTIITTELIETFNIKDYVYAYVKLLKEERIQSGEKINVVVPTGNFGNILAAFYAKQMGLPIDKLICASNENKVLYDFFASGTYDRNREFVLTTSPSMDILISSNLERLIYRIAGNDPVKNKELMDALSQGGVYKITDAMKEQLADFYGGFASEEETAGTIKALYENTGYVIDTHTAVAYKVYEDYKKATGDTAKTLIASTANPYKFGYAVYEALGEDATDIDEFELIGKLEKLTGTTCPKALSDTKDKEIRFTGSVEAKDMSKVVIEFINK